MIFIESAKNFPAKISSFNKLLLEPGGKLICRSKPCNINIYFRGEKLDVGDLSMQGTETR